VLTYEPEAEVQSDGMPLATINERAHGSEGTAVTEAKDQPIAEELELGALFAALADRHRRSIVEELLREPVGARRKCSSFGVGAPRSTMTHHFKVLRESGLITQFDYGNRAEVMLRRADLDARFPGLLDLVAAGSQQATSTPDGNEAATGVS
jgi:DNA-binding transcriptional ArsR family regulator